MRAAVYSLRMKSGFAVAVLLFVLQTLRAAAPDIPFFQDRSEQFPAEGELAGATMKKVHVNKDGIVYVLTDRGMARLFGNKLVLDHSFRPLIGKQILDVTIAGGSGGGDLFYLFEDELTSNDFAVGYAVKLPAKKYNKVAVGADGRALLSGPGAAAVITADHKLVELGREIGIPTKGFSTKADTTLLFQNGTNYFSERGEPFGLVSFSSAPTPAFRWPAPTNITCGCFDATGTAKGAYNLTRGVDERPDYYASRRWLLDDFVVDIARDGLNILALTKTGLNKIVFEPMTLEAKAAHYDDKIRKRHIRYGFCSELRLTRPGDPTSAEMIDTDNDGTWSEYYLASQAFRFAATGDEGARRNAWETFAAMERLESIAGLGGFPARTFERKGYKVSDPDRWRDAGDGLWEWKGHTSSDEITAHMFGCSVLWECAAKTPEEKGRIRAFVTKIADHLLRNNLYLIDVDGKPTLWGRWNPEYVNWFPHSIVDRRLNSAEIVGLFEFAYEVSGDEKYKAKGMDLLTKFGYLENILSPMKLIALTKGYIHQGNDMGDEWNHSDDLLSFDAYWTLHRWAFNNDLKKRFAAAIRDHWEIEKGEKNPYFAFIYASTKPKEFDLEGALWTLRRFPWDLVDWTVQNSHRLDITKLPANFRGQELKELLPPGERRITRWNSHPFVLDGGSGGHVELAGDEFLLPYWMGRYLKIIAPPEAASKRPSVWP
jgi:hypothetical protein